MDQVQNELSHYGVPGMRWGTRRSGSISKSGSAKKGPPSEDFKRMQDMKKRGTKNLTTAELKELTGRMQLEKQYKDLSKASVSKGKAYVSDLFKSTGKEIAKETVKNVAKKGIESGAKYVADILTDVGKAY